MTLGFDHDTFQLLQKISETIKRFTDHLEPSIRADGF
jgi:hypothetical protein